ncbi:reverse transcriptase domain-containing protein [Tanacetum coccineum]
MPFGLKNARATYQRLVDTIFEGQMGRNLEAYVDDMVIKSKTELEMIKDVEETLMTLKKVNMKLKPKKMFLRNERKQIRKIYSDFRRNQSKFRKNKGCKEHALTEQPETNATAKWQTYPDEEAFQAMKKLIAKLPTLTAPKKEEELMVYLSAANEVVITDKPISQILDNREATRRLSKWGIELEAYIIKYAPRSVIKGQVLADFLADTMTEDNPTQEKTNRSDDTLAERESREEQETTIIKAPKNLKAKADYSYALRLNFANSNNDAKYEALLAGLRIATKMKVEKMHAFVDSKLVANQVEGSKADALRKLAAVQCEGLTKGVLIKELNEQSVDMAEVNAIIEEATRTWMTLIQEYTKHGILPKDAAEA